MSDNKKINNAPEALDLRENSTKEALADAKKIELSPLPEKIEKLEQDKNIDTVDVAEGQSKTEQASMGGIVSASQVQQRQEARYRQIENVLADGLDDLFLNMDKDSQERFKKAGENAGRTINTMIEDGRSTMKKIVEIIKKWLSLIPGVNKFFLEQEAKIKADKIINIQKLNV